MGMGSIVLGSNLPYIRNGFKSNAIIIDGYFHIPFCFNNIDG
ncbi:MAG: hypothetical protein RHS_3930 [Robinsoniella sp. RHS]|nr:MAG: hypothetical protein RHS_3930 [Robinsoniella sp. RHS]